MDKIAIPSVVQRVVQLFLSFASIWCTSSHPTKTTGINNTTTNLLTISLPDLHKTASGNPHAIIGISYSLNLTICAEKAWVFLGPPTD